MKTVGELVKNARMTKNLTLDEVEKRTKIRKKFLTAIEADDYKKLPSLAIAKGFVKNYATYLRLDTERTMAIFRRQLNIKRRTSVLPQSVSEPLEGSLWQLTPNKAVGFVVAVLFFILGGYFFQQYRIINQPPQLVVEEPTDGMVVSKNTVAVFGKTDPDAAVRINGTLISTDETGAFFEEITLLEAKNSVVIAAEGRSGKETIVERTVVIEK